ncbi:TonB-dependent receptor protein [Erythrobacter litoralis]|nr:TonB-dependent receptor [Erythrobacter litoralis]AOL23837.1 TonB-dependent receptor protein [Erythrobacter litoralis]
MTKPGPVQFAASILLASTAMPAFAQDPDRASGDAQEMPQENPESGGVGTIMVTAERTSRSIQDTPISVTAVSGETLKATGAVVINDLAATVPNLTSTTGPQGSADANFFIRGVGQFDFIVTNDPGVGLYVDGVYLGRTVGAMLDAGDVERVEVLRGPQGTLFGRNTLGGAVSVVTKRPELGVVSGDAQATYGSRDRIDLDASLNLPIGDTAAARVYGFYRQQDGFADNVVTGEDFGRIDRYGARAQLRFEFGPDVTVDLSADYSLDKSNPAPSVLRSILPLPFFPPAALNDVQDPDNFYDIFASNSPEARNEVYGFSGTVTVDLGAAELKSITSYRVLDGFSTSDPDSTRFQLYDQLVSTEQDQFSQELQLTGTAFGDALEYLVGGYYFSEDAAQVLDLCFAPISSPAAQPFQACNTWTQGNDQQTESFAVFGQGRLSLTDSLSVTLGGRYTWDEKDIISNQFFDFRPQLVGPGAVFGFGLPPELIGEAIVLPIVTDLPGSASFEKFTPKIGVEYEPNPDLLFYASYSEGFRAGGFNGRLIAPQATIPTYEPDTNETFEVGLKSDLLDRALRFNLTLFHSQYRDIQQTIADPAVQFRVANAGDATLKGFETEIAIVPTTGLRFDFAVGYTDSEFEDVPVTVGPINGNRLPFSPEWTISAAAQYDIYLAGGTLTPRVDFRYQSEVFFTAFNLPFEEQEGYGLLNGRITWVDPSETFTLAAFGLNLFDVEYFTFGQNALASQGVAYNYLGRPREFGVSAGIRF